MSAAAFCNTHFMRSTLFGFFLDLDYLLAIIVATGLAHTVRKLHLSAARALDDSRKRQLPVSATTGISSRLRNFAFRYCHGHTSSLFWSDNKLLNAEKGFGLLTPSWHVHRSVLRFFPQTGQRPLQSLRQRKRMGNSRSRAS